SLLVGDAAGGVGGVEADVGAVLPDCSDLRDRIEAELDHCAFFSPMAGALRRRTKVHGQEGPSARPHSSSLLTVTSPRYVPDQSLPGLSAPVGCQLTTSPLTMPSIDPTDAPSGPCTAPLTFEPFCLSTHRVVRSEPIITVGEARNDPSHVPVTSTRVKVS